jgi:glycosyltransferase involved in cell wall biosynthesis
MDRRLRSALQPPGAFTEEALAALRAADTGSGQPLLLGYYPHFRTNPYQALLYRELRAQGIAPVGIRRAQTIAELAELQRAGLSTVLHLHWLHLVLGDALAASDTRAATREFLDLVDAHRAAGGRLVWTVHNILPHESRFEDAEAALSAEVARRADVMHVLASATADHVAPYFEVPRDRLLHGPHPSYAGAYEDIVSRLDARHELGLRPDDLVYLVIGAIRGYKGLEELLAAWPTLPSNPRRRLVIAGAPSEDPSVPAMLNRSAALPDVIVDARKIPAEEMQVFLRAADVAVMPYRRALNSGALLLALTFGLPVVVPAAGGLAEVVDEAFAVTFDPATPESLGGALIAAERLVSADARAAAMAAAGRFDPAELSRRFATGLRERLGAPPTDVAPRPARRARTASKPVRGSRSPRSRGSATAARPGTPPPAP